MKFGKEKKDIIIYILVAFIFGLFLQSPFHKINHLKDYSLDSGLYERRYKDEYKFISPLLECENFESAELSYFDSDIKSVADNLMQNGTIDDISYYFRDLNNGVWVGIQEDKKFAPASLMKLPLMISYLKQSEETPEILDLSYVFTQDESNYEMQNIEPEQVMSLGSSYTVGDLMYRMIVFSDNSALKILSKNSINFRSRVFSDLGIDIPETIEGEDFIDVRTYSRFFRVLYNASYLNLQNSNNALGILSKTQFKDGLIAGVPSHVVVAHKFGEREKDGVKQLHDCGIVYHPEKPYLICVMTRGQDFDKLALAIAEISRETYELVDRNFK